MGFFEINSTAAQQSIAYMGRQFTFRSSVYKGILNELSADPNLELGANMPAIVAALYVRKNGFPVPQVGELLTYEGKTYRITSIQTDVISYTLNLTDPTE
jgi:hypothetical protein